ncbi:XRE family transcriptional regulator [Microcoleus sp. herbarium14]|uniref:XRE family transcriptional regulator n=1 Tax=Microcoleus sp. herbarium14 TaxID=3055439 RepID=UPI002FD3C5A3
MIGVDRPYDNLRVVAIAFMEVQRERNLALPQVRRSDSLDEYARSPGMAMADIGALLKLARTFDVSIEELLDFVEQ